LPAGDQDDYIRVKDVLQVRRGHPPVGGFGELHPEPTGTDDCRVLESKDIQQFHLRPAGRWTKYQQIEAAFAASRLDGRASHIAPYREEFVFSPYKLVVAEAERPLRIAVSTQAVYPARGKLAVLREGISLEWLYLAAGVLNSAFGQALYRRLACEVRGRPSRPSDGVLQKAIEQVPLAHRSSSAALRHEAAQAAYRIATLCELQAATGRDETEIIVRLRQRFLATVSEVLQLSEDDARALLREVADFHLTDDPHGLFTPLEQLPPMPPLTILTSAERGDLAEFRNAGAKGRLGEAELGEWERLAELEDWEAALEADLPATLEISPGLCSESVGEQTYDYYPLGQHIVSAPGVCGGRPTFKGTRIDVRHVVPYLLAGEEARTIARRFGSHISEAAIREAADLLAVRGRDFFERERAEQLERAS